MNQQTQSNEARTGLVGGAILVALGALFLAQELFSFDPGRYGWPLFIIGPGLLLFAGMVLGGRGAGDFAIPASIVTTVGLILFTQNLTGHFQSWAYAWTLVAPTAVGLGLALYGFLYYIGVDPPDWNNAVKGAGGVLFFGLAAATPGRLAE